VNLDAEQLLERIRQEFPIQYELSSMRLLVDLLSQENEQLKAEKASQPPGFTPFADMPRPYAGSASVSSPGGTIPMNEDSGRG
jgi:hypothetical protein